MAKRASTSSGRWRSAVRIVGLPVLVCLLGALPAASRGDSVSLVPVRDTTLIEDAEGDWSNGSGLELFVGRTAQSLDPRRRAPIAFDLADSIPPGSIISAATLTLVLTDTNGRRGGIALHALTRAWGEGASAGSGGRGAPSAPGDATWVHAYYDDQFWENVGGDFLSPALAAATAEATGPTTWGSTAAMVADVQRWLDVPAENHGWILIGDESAPSTVRRFGAREQTDPELRPLLRIEYSPPCVPAPLGPSDWHRLCLMIDDARSGRGAEPSQPSTSLDPGFAASILPCADARLAALGAEVSACAALLERPFGNACDRADRHLATLAMNLCAGRLQTSCRVGPEAAGCGGGDLGDLLAVSADWMRQGDCRRAQACAAAAAQARP